MWRCYLTRRLDNAVIENPFAIEIVEASQEENGKLIKLKSPFDLVYQIIHVLNLGRYIIRTFYYIHLTARRYMPFHGNTHPDVAYKPSVCNRPPSSFFPLIF